MNAVKHRSPAGKIAAVMARLLPPVGAGNLRWVMAVMLVALLVMALAYSWKRWGPDLVSQPEYALSEESVVLTPQPEWIYAGTNVKAEVIRDGSLRNLNLLDDKAAIKIADAFKLHTWVKRVVRVRKQAPATVIVEVEYRRPVALVEVLYNNVLSYEPVDAEGVVLPEELFHHDEKQLEGYLRITADYSLPLGPLGTPWGDDRIVGGARIAALLQTVWRDWNLYRVVAFPGAEGERLATFELRTRGNSKIVWGHAPGAEIPGEASALQKIMWLAEYLRQAGPLDSGSSKAVELNVREAAGIEINELSASP
jgi:hypothetical protein